MSDNRTNEPTPEQVEAAAVASINSHRSRAGLPALAALDGVPNADEWRDDARAALVAAQGAAPQTEAYDHCCQHPKCPGGSLCCCVSERRLRDCWNQWREEIAGGSRQAFRDGYQAGQNDPAPWLTAPALPSSGVDKGELEHRVEEVIRDVVDMPLSTRLVLARAVVEWLKGQGR